ncbi:hypothetical protein KY290_008004 [Solanum tuberosum]|uniref:Uncharacterized protein n=1 Tax=Solanum tuberosum TaxID=4113 RepID=A0ABQ7W910_SOLTU|nr:hypothetical protein KY290_008004 [Solanum tuberosum]
MDLNNQNGGYGDGPDVYLSSDDEGLLNVFNQEMNQLEQNESVSVSGGEEYEFEDEWDEDEDLMNDDNFSEL